MTNLKMEKEIFQFSQRSVPVFFYAPFKMVKDLAGAKQVIFITDQNLFNLHADKFSGCQTIIISAGEASKNQQTVDRVINELIALIIIIIILLTDIIYKHLTRCFSCV